MIRPLKFRGWDGEQMLSVQDLTQGGEYWDWLGKQDVTLMQYTGRDDDNGNEIYEDDLIQDSRGQIGRVIWREGMSCFAVNWKMWDGSYQTDECISYGKVIGNIYENQELLEEPTNGTN